MVAVRLAVMPARPLEKGPSGTFARPPPGIDLPLDDFLMPRKMEFKGWVTDYKQCGYQVPTETEVSNFIKDLHQMVPDQYQKMADQNHRQYVVQE